MCYSYVRKPDLAVSMKPKCDVVGKNKAHSSWEKDGSKLHAKRPLAKQNLTYIFLALLKWRVCR